MTPGDRYVKLVEWSDEDNCFIGSCPELFYGGCHGSDPRAVFDELCRIVEETVSTRQTDGTPLPAGETLRNPELARTLRTLASEGVGPSKPRLPAAETDPFAVARVKLSRVTSRARMSATPLKPILSATRGFSFESRGERIAPSDSKLKA